MFPSTFADSYLLEKFPRELEYVVLYMYKFQYSLSLHSEGKKKFFSRTRGPETNAELICNGCQSTAHQKIHICFFIILIFEQ